MRILRVASLLLPLLWAAPASAVSVTLSYEITGGGNPMDPGPGNHLIITLTGDTTGAPAGTAVFAEVTYDGSILAPTGPATQTPIVSTFGFITWLASNPACFTSVCTVINQIGLNLTPRVPETNPVIGSVRLHVSAIGLIGSTIAVVPETFDFFGAAPPDPVVVVPEPGTASLVALGLAGLAATGRARRLSNR